MATEAYDKSPVYSKLGPLGRAGLAWECLRRNREYQDAYRSLVNKTDASDEMEERWGISFPGDPDLPADRAEIFWNYRDSPATVVLQPAEKDFPGAPRIGGSGLKLVSSRRGRCYEYLLLEGERDPVAVMLRPGVGAATPLAAYIEYDGDYQTRCRAARDFLRAVSGLGPCADADDLAVTERRNVILSLWAADLRRTGLPHRKIAMEIFGRENVPSGAHWRRHRLCGLMFRLIQRGNDLIEGDYRDLLRKRRRTRRRHTADAGPSARVRHPARS